MTFQDAQHRLLAYVRDRIQHGERTERGIARRIGASQPHVHNVLKGVRNLSLEMSDSILNLFHISILDLATLHELETHLQRRKAPPPELELVFLDARLGPEMPWPQGLDWRRRYPAPFTAPMLPAGLVMAALAPDPDMAATLAHTDLALLDTTDHARAGISPEGLYVVDRAGEAVLRYVRPGARREYLVTDAGLADPQRWERISLAGRQSPPMIRARVLWLGREQDRDLPPAQRGRFVPAMISS